MAEKENNNQSNNNNKKPEEKKFSWTNIAIILVAALFIVGIIYSINGCQPQSKEVSYSEI